MLRPSARWGRRGGRCRRRGNPARRRELAQQARLQLAGQVFETTLDALLVTDAQHRVVGANPLARRLIGLAADDLDGAVLPPLVDLLSAGWTGGDTAGVTADDPTDRARPIADVVFGIDNALWHKAQAAQVLDGYDGPAARRPAVAEVGAGVVPVTYGFVNLNADKAWLAREKRATCRGREATAFCPTW